MRLPGRDLLGLFVTVQERREESGAEEAIAALEEVEDFVRHTEPETARALESFTLLKYLGRLKTQWAEEVD